jgi:hypothetical protein
MADFAGRMIGAMQADVKVLEEVEADPAALTQAVTVIVISGVSALIGNFFRSGLVSGVTSLIGSLLGYALFSLFVFLIGTKVMPENTTKANFGETFRTVGFAAAPGVFYILAVIPFLGYLISMLIGLWSLVIAVIAVRAVLDYSNTGRAIVVCILAFIACVVTWFVIVAPLMAVVFLSRMAAGG